MSEVSIDVADAIQSALNAVGRNASAWPLPADFERRLPFTRLTLLSGERGDIVSDTFRLQVETWAATQAEAIAEANLVAAAILDMAGTTLGGVQCYRAGVPTLPHDAHDPYHSDLACAESLAQVTVRTRHI